MLKTLAFLAAGLVAGVAVSALWRGPDGAGRRLAESDTALGRIEVLEAALADARNERAELKRQLDALEAELATRPGPATAAEAGARTPESTRGEPDAEATAQAPVPLRRARRFGPPGTDDEAELHDRLTAAGIAPDRAQWIADRLAALRMQVLEAQYQAAREGRAPDSTARLNLRDALREELGPADYESYLVAMGFPTDVDIREVIPSSPAARAGLKPGDRVVTYAGQRVFDVGDLNRLTLEGQTGETVAVDVIRDGQQLQLYLPRGPIGITGGRFGPGLRRGVAR